VTAPPLIVDQKYDANGNLVEISWTGWDGNTTPTLKALIPIQQALAKMGGSAVLTIEGRKYGLGDQPSPFRTITEGAANKTLVYAGKPAKLSRQQALLLGTLAEHPGRVFKPVELLAILYPNPNTQPISGLNQVYKIMGELRAMYPELMDRKAYRFLQPSPPVSP
jgi:hypothetical protein